MEKEISLGRFRFSDTEVSGELTIDGANSSLYVEAPTNFVKGFRDDFIHGYLKRNSLVTLVKCLVPEADQLGWSYGRGEHVNFANIFPHYVVRGAHFDPRVSDVGEIHFGLTDAEGLFPDHRAYGRITEPDDILKARIAAAADVELGEHFEVFYFAGEFKVFECALPFGFLTVEHSGSTKWPNVTGLSVENKILFRLRFAEPVAFGEAISKIHSVRRMFSALTGRPQTIFKPTLSFVGESQSCEIVETMATDFGLISQKSGIHGIGLINGIWQPELMRDFVQRWFETEKEMRDVWVRFSDSLERKNHYSRDRLIAAANLFDLIPPSCNELEKVKDAALLDAIERSKKIFKDLPVSPIRNAALESLGRITKPNLRTKISSWNSPLKSKYPDTFGDIDIVTGIAIETRNFFIHGTRPKFDVGREFPSIVFLTKALEFAFVAGYLLRIGWDFADWRKTYSGSFTYFGQFVREYELEIDEIKAMTEELSTKMNCSGV